MTKHGHVFGHDTNLVVLDGKMTEVEKELLGFSGSYDKINLPNY